MVSPLTAQPSPAQSAPPAPGPAADACVMCGGSELIPSYEMADKHGHHVAIRRCRRCSALLPAYARPAESTVATRAQVRLHEEDWKDESAESMRQLLEGCRGIVHALRDFLGEPSAERLVCEFGAGRGGLLGALKQAGYQVLGCEPSPLLCDIAYRWTGVTPEELLNCPAEHLLERLRTHPAKRRTFVFWHVLEHLAAPWDAVRAVAEVAGPGDHLVGQLPLLDSIYLYPEHYFFATEPLLAGLAQGSGFELVYLDYDHRLRFVTFALRRTAAPLPAREWQSELPRAEGGAVALDSLLVHENRRLRALAEARTQLSEERGRTITSMEAMLVERMEGLNRQSALIAERDAHLRQLSEQLSRQTHALDTRTREGEALRRQLSETQAALEALHLRHEEQLRATARLAALLCEHPAPSAPRGPGARDGLVTLISLHSTQRLFRRWQEVRGHHVSDVAPSVSERVTLQLAHHLPAVLMGRLRAEQLTRAVHLAVQAFKATGKVGKHHVKQVAAAAKAPLKRVLPLAVRDRLNKWVGR